MQELNDISNKAEGLFRNGFCCSEAVFLAIAEALNLKSELIPKIATGFCGGIARTSNICGAVTGAVMGISLITGRNSPDESREKNHQLVRDLMSKFEAQFGSLMCSKLIGCRLDTPEGYKEFIDKNLREKCIDFVSFAAITAVKLIMS